MPKIRDYTFAYETQTTNAGITIPMCSYAQNDLILVFAMADTGAGTWGCTGYTQLFARNNTCSFVCYYKIAGVSESDVVVTNTVNETYNGCVITIQDVDTTNPFGNPAVQTNTTQAAVAKFNMNTITTTVANSLAIYVSANAGTGVPSFIEGIAHGLIGADGSAESLGVGWSFHSSTGTTPTVVCSNVATGAGVKATIQIAAPSSGATIIPTYISSDNSTLIDYINGTTAYNGNTAMAATADTNFGTSLNGITANDATVVAAADVGINSFHSFARLTNAATANQVSGAELVIAAANRFNASSKNILTTLRPQSPGQYQRLTSINSTRGVWMGVRSNTASGGATTGYKIWRIHGVGTNWGLDNKIPIVINTNAGNTITTSGTLDAAVITSVGFWTSSIGSLQSGMEFGMLWLMDTVSLAGGNSSYPITIPDIIETSANSHERLSALQQGSSQMLCLMDLQIGDGTNSTYLNLDSTAIEFPKQYNLSSGDVYYNSTDNKVGLTYYASSTDTIIHKNSVISSSSRFKWGLNSSSSTAATYDFSNTAVIGAGTITLARAITIDSLTINNFSTLDISNLTLTNSSILNPPSSNNSITTNSTTALDNCSIDVTTVSAGNYLVSVADPTIFENCSFTGSGTAGHAIRITTPGTYSFIGNAFTGFGANATNFAAIYNDSGGSVTLNISGGGSTPTYRNGTAASTTINNNVVLQLTNLISGSDIVILDAGTETERVNIDSNSGSTYNYTYQYVVSDEVDIGVFKAGYIPFYVRNYTLGNTDSSLPISQTLDRNYTP